MVNLSSILYDNYCNTGYSYDSYSPLVTDNKASYMIVPVNKDIIEVPVFILKDFIRIFTESPNCNIDAISVNLNYKGSINSYKSIDSSIRNTLSADFKSTGLKKIATIDNQPYYGMCGTILDKEYRPVMMESWLIKRTPTVDAPYPFRYESYKPILRVSPEVFICKSDGIQKYIINKIIPTVLDLRIISPYVRSDGQFKDCSIDDYHKVKVEIEECPFKFKKTDQPSISTTNKELLNTVINNINEMLI